MKTSNIKYVTRSVLSAAVLTVAFTVPITCNAGSFALSSCFTTPPGACPTGCVNNANATSTQSIASVRTQAKLCLQACGEKAKGCIVTEITPNAQ